MKKEQGGQSLEGQLARAWKKELESRTLHPHTGKAKKDYEKNRERGKVLYDALKAQKIKTKKEFDILSKVEGRNKQ